MSTLLLIGIVHLFRQYFFELDTFLAICGCYVWLSPGSTVELVAKAKSRRKNVENRVEEASSENYCLV